MSAHDVASLRKHVAAKYCEINNRQNVNDQVNDIANICYHTVKFWCKYNEKPRNKQKNDVICGQNPHLLTADDIILTFIHASLVSVQKIHRLLTSQN